MAQATQLVRARIPSCPLPRVQPWPLKTQPRPARPPSPRSSGPALCTWSYPDDGEQLVTVNASIAIDVVELEVPAQLLFHLPLEDQAERRHVLHEVDVAVLDGAAAVSPFPSRSAPPAEPALPAPEAAIERMN